MLTERDSRLLGFLRNWAFMELGQCARFVQSSEQVTRRRLNVMVKYGLVEKESLLGSRSHIFYVSRAGLEYLGYSSESSSYRGIKLAQVEHDRILVDIAIDFALKNPDYEIFGELEMRRRDSVAIARDEEPRFAISRYSGGRFVNVFPDMVAVKGNSAFYIEYEHTPKDKKRLASLMKGYASADKVTAIQYHVAPAALSHVQDVYQSIENELPLFNGKPKIRIKEYGQE